MKFCVITGNWADGLTGAYGVFATTDDAYEWAKGEKLLGRFRDYVVRPYVEAKFRSPSHCPPADLPEGMEVTTS